MRIVIGSAFFCFDERVFAFIAVDMTVRRGGLTLQEAAAAPSAR